MALFSRAIPHCLISTPEDQHHNIKVLNVHAQSFLDQLYRHYAKARRVHKALRLILEKDCCFCQRQLAGKVDPTNTRLHNQQAGCESKISPMRCMPYKP